MVAEKFKQLEFSKEFTDAIVEEIRLIIHDRRRAHDHKRQELVNQRTAWEAKRKTAQDKLIDGILSDNEFNKIKNDIGQELDSIDGRLVEVERQQSIDIDAVQEVLNFTRNVYDAYLKASPQMKHVFLSIFWERFEMENGVIIKSVCSPLFEHLLKVEQIFLKSETPINKGISHVYNSSLMSPESVSEFVM